MQSSLADKHIVVTAGGTREPIDAVRFIGNYSSGKQGYAFARQAVARGARVTLIGANLIDPRVVGCDFVSVATGIELGVALSSVATSASAVIMAAAVADFKLDQAGSVKIKKSATGGAIDLHLVATADIIAELAHSKITPQGCLLIAFAAETLSGDELIAEARRKLRAKSVDYVIANDVSEGKIFGSDETDVLLINDENAVHFAGDKDTVAGHILDLIFSEI